MIHPNSIITLTILMNLKLRRKYIAMSYCDFAFFQFIKKIRITNGC